MLKDGFCRVTQLELTHGDLPNHFEIHYLLEDAATSTVALELVPRFPGRLYTSIHTNCSFGSKNLVLTFRHSCFFFILTSVPFYRSEQIRRPNKRPSLVFRYSKFRVKGSDYEPHETQQSLLRFYLCRMVEYHS